MVTVLMPAYNAERFIAEAIKSILDQTFIDFEFLIINDGSIDKTEKIISFYSDPRIRYEKNEKNYGLIYTLNKGFEIAKGKYIARMDADDISFPKRLEKQVDFMEMHPEIGICGGQMEIFGTTTGGTDYPLTHENCQIRLLDQPCFSNNNFIFRSEAFNKYDFYFKNDFLHAEDYKFYTDILFKIKGANLPDIITKYRQHEEAVTHKHFNIAFENRKKIRIEYIQSLLKIKPKIAFNFYNNIGYKRLSAVKKVRILLIQKFHNIDPSFIDELLFSKLWYKDALYESEKNYSVFFKYTYIFQLKLDLESIKNWINVLKHMVKHRL